MREIELGLRGDDVWAMAVWCGRRRRKGRVVRNFSQVLVMVPSRAHESHGIAYLSLRPNPQAPSDEM